MLHLFSLFYISYIAAIFCLLPNLHLLLVCLMPHILHVSHISYTISFNFYLESSIHMLHLLSSISSLIYLYLSSLSISHFPLDFFIRAGYSLTHSLTHPETHTSFAHSSRNHTKKAQPVLREKEKGDDTKKNVLPAFGNWRRRCRWTCRPFPQAEIADQKVRQLLFFVFFLQLLYTNFDTIFDACRKLNRRRQRGGSGARLAPQLSQRRKTNRLTERERERGRKEAKNRFKNANSSAWPGKGEDGDGGGRQGELGSSSLLGRGIL